MARQTNTPVNQRGNPDVTWRGAFSLEQREKRIQEAAYYLYEQRGRSPGHDLDDWLAAEAAIDRGSPEWEALDLREFEVQQSGVRGPGADDELKRIIKQHPQKAIPQVESVEPGQAPPKQ